MSRSRPRTTVADERSPLSGEGQCSRGCSKQARPDGDIRAGRVDRRGGGWGRTRRSQPCSFRGRVLRRDDGLFLIAPVAALASAHPVGRGMRRTGSKAIKGRKRQEIALAVAMIARPRAAPVRARHEADIVRSVADDALPSCPCAGARGPRSQGRARRPRRAGRARASGLCHRPAVAPQPAAFSDLAERGGDRGAGGRPLCRHRHRAVSRARGCRSSLFHRGRAPYERARGGAAAARGRRSRRARARLPRDPARSARHQPRRDRPLPQERLSRNRPPSRLLRGRRRCVAVREAARVRPARAGGGAALFSPDYRIHLRAGLHHDGARLGRSKVQAGARLRVPALARSHHHLHELRTGRLRALRHGGRAQAARPRAGRSMSAAPAPISSTPPSRPTSAGSCS